MPNCKFNGGRKRATTNSFSLSKVECAPQEINSREIRLHLPFSANWNKRDSVWKTRIHFKSDVFTAVAVVDAKAPLYFNIILTLYFNSALNKRLGVVRLNETRPVEILHSVKNFVRWRLFWPFPHEQTSS